LLQQKVALLELQAEENKKREETIKRMQDSMLSALHLDSSNSVPQELQIAVDQHKKEIEELSINHRDVIQSYERQLSSTNSKIAELEKLNKEYIDKLSALDINYKDAVKELNDLQKEYQSKEYRLSEEKKKLDKQADLESDLKVTHLNLIIEKLKSEHQKEIEHTKSTSEASLKDIKYIHQQEKLVLQERNEKQQTIIKSLQLQKESSNNSNISEMQANYVKEIKELNVHLNDYKKQHEEEVLAIKKQRDDALRKVEALEHNLLTAKGVMKASQNDKAHTKAKSDKHKELVGQNELLIEEGKKQKKIITQLKTQLSKLETSEKALKSKVSNNDNKIDDRRSFHVINLRPDSGNKDEIDRLKVDWLPKSDVKEVNADYLSLLNNSRKEIDQSMRNSIVIPMDSRQSRNVESSKTVFKNTDSVLQSAPKNTVAIKKAEYNQCRNCMKMIDHSIEMRCKICKAWVITGLFIEHIKNTCQEKIADMTTEEKQLKTECLFSRMAEKLEKLKQIKEKAGVEIDRFALELKQTQKKCAYLEESKAESELSLKTEIKFLISKLLKYKKRSAKKESPQKASKGKSPLSIAKSISNFVKLTPHSRASSNVSDKKVVGDENMMSPPTSECKTEAIPQFVKKTLTEVNTNFQLHFNKNK
jgi:hypothetical protein